jgi:cation:H+ antiporter
MDVLWFVAGLALLVAGAEALVRGASRLALLLGMSPLVIGLTVVAFGTSSPELAVSLESGLSGQSAIAVGNVIGSNIFNVLFILGLSALVVPLIVAQQLIRLDVPLMVAVSLLVLLFSLDGAIDALDGAVLVLGLAGYLALLIYQGRRESAPVQDEYGAAFGAEPGTNAGWGMNAGLVAGGLLMLVVGSRWLVASAVVFAQWLGVSELVIGLTIVAAGTSLPEVVTSLVAALRGERDIAVGNVVGSNLFHLMGVLGLAALVTPGGLEVTPAVAGFDLPVMTAVAFACLPVFFTGGVITRTEGAMFLLYYVAYTLYVVLAASRHEALEGVSVLMLYFVLPLTIVTLAVVSVQEARRRARVS